MQESSGWLEVNTMLHWHCSRGARMCWQDSPQTLHRRQCLSRNASKASLMHAKRCSRPQLAVTAQFRASLAATSLGGLARDTTAAAVALAILHRMQQR